MKIMGKQMRIRWLVLLIFVSSGIITLADANSEKFAEMFREAGSGQGDVIERVVNVLYYGLILIYRGVSIKVSQLCGVILIFIIIIDVLGKILQEMSQVNVYAVFKMLIPKIVRNLVISFFLVIKVSYPESWGMGRGVMTGMAQGTLVTQFTEMFFTMFYRLGLLFFNDSSMMNVTPGRLASLLFEKPLNLLQDVFGFMTIFGMFTNIAKIILLLFCLWICGKIIAIYIANIFMALMLSTFSVFYLIFLTLESTAQIGQKGINMIIVQSVTLFMTVAMMGISYQVINLIAAGNSIQGIAALAVVLLMLQQAMENVAVMAISITSGGGLGTSHTGAFTGLSQAAGMVLSGLAMFGAAKLDEIAGKQAEGSGGNSKSEIERRAKELVGGPATENERRGDRNDTGLSYRKGQGLKENMVSADELMEKKRGWSWTDSAGLASFLLQMSTGDLSDLDNLKRQKDELDRLFNRNNNYPYSEEYKIKAGEMLKDSWAKFIDEARKLNIGSEVSSMNESLRAARQNAQQEILNSKNKEISRN